MRVWTEDMRVWTEDIRVQANNQANACVRNPWAVAMLPHLAPSPRARREEIDIVAERKPRKPGSRGHLTNEGNEALDQRETGTQCRANPSPTQSST